MLPENDTQAIPLAKTAAAVPVVGKTIGTDPAPPKAAATLEDAVQVVALKPYMGGEDKREIDDKPYPVSRARAAELHARGLARYADEADMQKAVDDAAQTAADAVRRRMQPKTGKA